MINPKNRSLALVAAVIFIALLTLVAWKFLKQDSGPPQELLGVLRFEPRQLGSLELIDHNEKLVSEDIFKGKWSFVFFGYTSCPDVCPTTLQVLKTVIGGLEKSKDDLLLDSQVIFVSVDPERDIVSNLYDYVGFYNRDFIGLTGSKENIDNVVRQFGAGYALEEADSSGQYLVSHSSAVFLVASDLRLVAAFSQPHIPKTIVTQYKAIRTYFSQ